MFGFVTANVQELTKEQKKRYSAVYCGICRRIRLDASRLARWALQYDMAFLALLLGSLYEPEEQTGKRACGLHPIRPRPWVDNEIITYCAHMNVALAYYKFRDDDADDGSRTARFMANRFEKSLAPIQARWPRQCQAMEDCIRELSRLEAEGCPNPDRPAACFGRLMGELMVLQEDTWAPTLRVLGDALGRFIYLADGAVDYRHDEKKNRYNPFRAQGLGKDWNRWEDYLMLTMGRCSQAFESLPLVQDKDLLDNILYSGVWTRIRIAQKKEERHDKRSL